MAKAHKTKRAEFRYEPQDVEPRDPAADDTFIDTFIERNREELIESIDEAEVEEARGEGKDLEEILKDMAARRVRNASQKRR